MGVVTTIAGMNYSLGKFADSTAMNADLNACIESFAELASHLSEMPVVVVTLHQPYYQFFYSSSPFFSRCQQQFLSMCLHQQTLTAQQIDIETDQRFRHFFDMNSAAYPRTMIRYPLVFSDSFLAGSVDIFDVEKKSLSSAQMHSLELLVGQMVRAIQHELAWVEVEDTLVNFKKEHDNRDRFFSMISHDMRTPFNGILCYAEMLLADYQNNDTASKMMIEEIQLSASIALNLMDNMLKWSMVDAGNMVFLPEQVSLHTILNDVFKLVAGVAKKKSISLSIEGVLDIPLFVDRNMMSSVLQNLLSNAIKFTPEKGAVQLKFSESNTSVCIQVQDSGVGMSADKVRKMFHEESMSSTRGTAGESGTGLGLFLCKQFVEANGGEISVMSTEGKGTIFTVALPKLEPH